MKKYLTLLLTAAALSASLATHAQETVTSVNAVGMVKITVPANGGLFLARYDFKSADGQPIKITDVIGTSVPAGTTLFIWDRVNQAFYPNAPVLQELFGQKQWSNNTITIQPGDAFFIKNASMAPEFNVVFSGEVPGVANNSQSLTISNVVGFIGYPFPVLTQWEDTQLSNDVPAGTTLFMWNSLTQSYMPGVTKQSLFGNVAWSSNPVINPGHGFWLTITGVPPSVTEVKPYLWP